jgi:hypothetical protein
MGALQVVTLPLRQLFQSRAALAAENPALCQQIAVLQRSTNRPGLRRRNRIFWVWLSRLWRGWQSTLFVVQPETVIRWHRKGFRLYWRWTSRSPCGRPEVDAEIHPTQRWAAQQVVEAFPHDLVPRYLLRDRDRIYGSRFSNRARSIGIEEVLIAPHSPWQNPFVERLIGSIRRGCLDHVLVTNEAHLPRVLREHFAYYHDSRPHQSLEGNAPRPREIEPPSPGRIVAEPQVGGLHHRYRRAA